MLREFHGQIVGRETKQPRTGVDKTFRQSGAQFGLTSAADVAFQHRGGLACLSATPHAAVTQLAHGDDNLLGFGFHDSRIDGPELGSEGALHSAWIAARDVQLKIRHVPASAPFAQSTLTSAARMISVHLLVSARMNTPKSAGVPSCWLPPRFSIALCTSAERITSLTAVLIVSTMPAAVPGGATIPDQKPPSRCGKPISCAVGTSGRSFRRLPPATASIRSLPACAWGRTSGDVSK